MRYFKRLAAVVLLTIILLIASFFIYKLGYKRFYSTELAMMNEKLNGTHPYDILFLGSSRTYYHVNPKVIDSITKLDSYNGGMEGANFIEMRMILECYLSSHKAPRVVAMEIAPGAFESDQRPFFNPTFYYPFLDNKIVFNTVNRYKNAYVLKYLPFYQLTEADDYVRQGCLSGLLGKKNTREEICYKGFKNYGTDTIHLPFKRVYHNLNAPVKEQGITYLESIVKICLEKKIQPVIIFPPLYKFSEALNPQFFAAIERICQLYHIPFFNYTQLQLCSNHTLFVDDIHLNDKGANLFSAILANDIASVLKAR